MIKLTNQQLENMKREWETLSEVVKESIIKDCKQNNKEGEITKSNIKFDKRVEAIYNSINESFNLEGMLLNYIEINEFKTAIEKGLKQIL